MRRNLLNHYVVALLKSIELDIFAYIKTRNAQSLHRLRVDIKKIKAVFTFAEKIYNEKYHKQRLKPLFIKAGKIREIQINAHLLSTLSPPPQRLMARLKAKENILVKQFIKNGPRYVRVINNLREITIFPEMLPAKKIVIKYFNKELKKANKHLQKTDREGMHGYRVKIKRLMYVYQVLPKRLQNAIGLNEAEIDKQQKRLGIWHDTYAALSFFSREHFPKKGSGYISKLQEKEKKQFIALADKLTRNRK